MVSTPLFGIVFAAVAVYSPCRRGRIVQRLKPVCVCDVVAGEGCGMRGCALWLGRKGVRLHTKLKICQGTFIA